MGRPLKSILPCLLVLMSVSLSAQTREANYDESKVPAYELPEPLVFSSGKPVSSRRQWKKRRAELMELFRERMYGREPSAPKDISFEVTKVVPDAFGGLSTMKEVRIMLDPSGEHYLVMLMFVPNGAGKPVPAFLGINFKGNHTTTDLEEVSLPDEVQLRNYGPGYQVPERGLNARRWPYEYILEHGYAVCTFCVHDPEPDLKGHYDYGIRKVYDGGSPRPDSWGSVSAWAWSLCRALDYLCKDPSVDARRVAVIGHSRLGKTALWAGAMDRRFAMVVANDSGCSGAALSRRVYGENLGIINTSFPYWFCSNYKEYNDAEASLPFDQHELIAMIAPRPVYVASASEDLWADPYGEYLSLVYATPVYRLFGYDGFSDTSMPAAGDSKVIGRMGHHIREGQHDCILYDWERFITFADRFLKK